jgi:hypothetical protein
MRNMPAILYHYKLLNSKDFIVLVGVLCQVETLLEYVSAVVMALEMTY